MTIGILAAGVFEGFFELVADFLGVLYRVTGSYGIAIILLTIIVMVVTAPLTLKSTRSMLQMQRHQPELKRLQAKYKDDRDKLNQEMMAFYKENGINPLSGCVPVAMQMPIFIILYQVLRGIGNRSGGSASGIGHVAGQLATKASFTPWKLHDQVFAPQHLSTTSKMYMDLQQSSKMSFLGVDLSLSPLDALKIGVATAIPFLVLVVAMLVSQIIQNRQIQGRTKNQQVNPQQQAIMKIVPFMLPIFSFTLPAGLGLYYFVQGLCRIGLQGYITRAVYGPHHATMEADKATAPPSDSRASDKASKTTGGSSGGSKASTSSSAKPKSAKSAAVQRKASGTPATQAGRRSGDPRASGRSQGRSGTPNERG